MGSVGLRCAGKLRTCLFCCIGPLSATRLFGFPERGRGLLGVTGNIQTQIKPSLLSFPLRHTQSLSYLTEAVESAAIHWHLCAELLWSPVSRTLVQSRAEMAPRALNSIKISVSGLTRPNSVRMPQKRGSPTGPRTLRLSDRLPGELPSLLLLGFPIVPVRHVVVKSISCASTGLAS